MNENIKRVFKYVGVFLSVIVVFNVLLYLVSLIPSEKLEKNVVESARILKKQETRYLYSKDFGVFIDTAGDSIAVNMLYGIDNNHPYESYMKARRNYKEGITEVELVDSNGEGITAKYSEKDGTEHVDDKYDAIKELNDFVDGKLKTSFMYAKYWQGFLVFYRPLFVFFNIEKIKSLQLIISSILIIVLTCLLYKKFGKIPAIIYFCSLLCCRLFFGVIHT